jgi:putative peptidoglycan lipid II flippase
MSSDGEPASVPREAPLQTAAPSGVAAAAMLIMAGNLFSRLLGLVREQLAAGLFGTGDRIAAFQIADNVHTLLFDLVISGMLQAALIPVLIQWSAPDPASRAELRRVSGALLTLLVGVVGSGVVLGIVFAPRVVRTMTALGGEEDRPAEISALTVDLVRIILPAVFFLAVGTLLMGVLYALSDVTVPALSLTARNAAVVVCMLLFAGPWGVKSMAVGVVAGAVLIATMNAIPLWRKGALPRLNLEVRHPGVRQVLRLYLPIFAGLIVSTVAVVVDRNLAWRAEEDALGAMRYATTLVQFVLGLVAAAIALAALPTLSIHFANRDETQFRRTLERALIVVTLLIVPAVLGLAAVADPAVALIFEHGETGAADARLIVIALLGYLPGTLFAAYDQVLIYAFYARRNTWVPVLVGVGATIVYFAVAIPFARAHGMIGLVLANSAQFVAHALVMAYLARRALGARGWERLRFVIVRCLAAGIIMAGLSAGMWLSLRAALPEGASAVVRIVVEGLRVIVPALFGALAYALLLRRLGIGEADETRAAVLAKLRLRSS